MIGTSTWDYMFIRSCMIGLQLVTPLSVLYCFAILVRPSVFHISPFLDVWPALETAFFFLFYLPYKYHLQRSAEHPLPACREHRRILFDRCLENVPDPEKYLAKWFLHAPASEIKRDNVKDFIRWAFLNTGKDYPADNDELDEYVEKMERSIGRKIEPGRGNSRCIRLSLDKVDMSSHRSLTWYLCIFVVDTITTGYMHYHSFEFHRTPLRKFFTVFPFRPFTLFTRHVSPAKSLTYWHRPHTSKTKLPILFIHGIGIGLYPYVNFLAELNAADRKDGVDEDVGVIAIEIMSVSFRITEEALQKDEMCREIDCILKAHGWEKFVLVSHSYGSVISTHLIRSPQISPKIGSILLVDPVSFLLHLPGVAYNFLHRKPKGANEYQLYYFASQDPGVAHTLSRRFFWSENILWKEEIQDRQVTVSLGGRDLIVDSQIVRAYLEDPTNDETASESGGENERNDHRLKVLWFQDLDHAQVFDKSGTMKMLASVARNYCKEK